MSMYTFVYILPVNRGQFKSGGC